MATEVFSENKILQQKIVSGPYMFFWPYHFDTYGPHTGPFSLWFFKEKTKNTHTPGPRDHMIKLIN